MSFEQEAEILAPLVRLLQILVIVSNLKNII